MTANQSQKRNKKEKNWKKNFSRVSKYTLVRGVLLAITVVATVYLIIIIANWGGHMDEAVKANIQFMLLGRRLNGWLDDVPQEERLKIMDETAQAMEEAAGLNEPFLWRCMRFLGRGLTLNWGKTDLRPSTSQAHGTNQKISRVILETLPRTLLLFGTAYLILFFASVFLALPLTKLHGSWLDKLVITLSPLASAPAWIYGIVLNLLSLKLLGNAFGNGGIEALGYSTKWFRLSTILKQMTIPFLAIFFSGLFQGIYAWRTLFILYAREEYVEVAKAKGIPPRLLERRYILRPILPNLVTSFALLFATLWQEAIALEYIFRVAGIGQLFWNSLTSIPPANAVLVAIVTTFAYLLAITIFVLEFTYAFIDPRVKIASGERVTQRKRKSIFWRLKQLKKRKTPEIVHYQPPSSIPFLKRIKINFSTFFKSLWSGLQRLKGSIDEMKHYPSSLIGLVIILAMIGASIYTVFTSDYNEMIATWRGKNEIWMENPKNAFPVWINLFRKDDLPSSFILSSLDEADLAEKKVEKKVKEVSENMTQIMISFPFSYAYNTFPQNFSVNLNVQYQEKLPLIIFTWRTPDGREIELTSFTVNTKNSLYQFAHSQELQRLFDSKNPHKAMLAQPKSDPLTPLQGEYELQVKAYVFEEDANVDAEFILYGKVHGLAGTDGKRRDLMVPLSWGMPIALTFGIIAAAGTSFLSMFLAALGAWFGGWVDALIQRFTEINLIIPFLPVSMMIFVLYSKSIWVILSVTILLSVFGNAIKNYRAIFLQVKEEAYIEATRAYGANGWRIILRYMIPRILPILIPRLVLLVPGYVFLETTLALFGVSDPILPTWGKLLVEGFSSSIYSGYYHIILEPLALLLLLGFAFVLLGISLERIFQPRLRKE